VFFYGRKRKMPTTEKRKLIEEKVDNIILENEALHTPAFDIVKFLKAEGFAVAAKLLDDDTTGMLLVDDENFVPNTTTHKLIVINNLLQEQDNYIQRRRFIIAHEYAHYVLHKEGRIQYAHRDTSKRDSPIEKEADFFARCLLMPGKAIRGLLNLDFIKVLSIDDKISLVSRIFNVTPKKAKQRLEEDFSLT